MRHDESPPSEALLEQLPQPVRETGSEEQGPHAADLALLLHEDLKVLVDDGDREQDPSSRPNGAQEVSQDREGPDAQPTEGRSCGDVPIEFMDHGGLSVASHHHLLLLQLLCNIFGRGT